MCGFVCYSWGKTSSGKRRYRCPECETNLTRVRHDNKQRQLHKYFVTWLTGSHAITEIAHELRVSRRHLQRLFSPYWSSRPRPTPPTEPVATIVIDGVRIASDTVCLVMRSLQRILFWAFTKSETSLSWGAVMAIVPPPKFVVSDGQKGIAKALETHWSDTRLQRCLIHFKRGIIKHISLKPKMLASQELLGLTRELLLVKTRRQKRRWLRRYHHWEKRYYQLIQEKTVATEESIRYAKQEGKRSKKWWHTHSALHSAWRAYKEALPHLFTFVGKNHLVPRTTNHVEGGINARIKE